MCEHLRLRVKKEQLLQTVNLVRDGQSGNRCWFRMLWAAGRQPVQQVAPQLETHIIPDLLDLKKGQKHTDNQQHQRIERVLDHNLLQLKVPLFKYTFILA